MEKSKEFLFDLVLYFILSEIYICIPETLIRTFHTSLCEFTALDTNSKGDLKPVLNVRLKNFWYTKINLTQIWYAKFN